MGRKIIDLSGNQFGHLTVVRPNFKKGIHTYYLCKCDCGRETIVRADLLKIGKTTSCGCVLEESKKNFGKRVQKTVVYDGVEYSISGLCKAFNIAPTTFYRKHNKGLSIEEIVKGSK